MMFVRGPGIGTPLIEPPILLPTMVPPTTIRQLSPFAKKAAPILSRTGMRGLRDTADSGISNGLTIVGVLGVVALGLWAFSGKKKRR